MLLSDEDSPELRWRFAEITGHSFRWSAETSHDRGVTWQAGEEMFANRTAPPSGG